MDIDKSQVNQGLEVMSRHADAAARPRHHDTLSGLGDRRAHTDVLKKPVALMWRRGWLDAEG